MSAVYPTPSSVVPDLSHMDRVDVIKIFCRSTFHNMEHKVLGARALGKAIQLLFSFDTNIPEQSLFELSRKLRFPPSTTHRLLKVMMSVAKGLWTVCVPSARPFSILMGRFIIA